MTQKNEEKQVFSEISQKKSELKFAVPQIPTYLKYMKLNESEQSKLTDALSVNHYYELESSSSCS